MPYCKVLVSVCLEVQRDLAPSSAAGLRHHSVPGQHLHCRILSYCQYEVYYECLAAIGVCCNFIARAEIIGVSARKNLVGISVALSVKWTILIFSKA